MELFKNQGWNESYLAANDTTFDKSQTIKWGLVTQASDNDTKHSVQKHENWELIWQ